MLSNKASSLLSILEANGSNVLSAQGGVLPSKGGRLVRQYLCSLWCLWRNTPVLWKEVFACRTNVNDQWTLADDLPPSVSWAWKSPRKSRPARVLRTLKGHDRWKRKASATSSLVNLVPFQVCWSQVPYLVKSKPLTFSLRINMD